MASLTEHTMLNGLEENLKEAIEYVGGTVPNDSNIWEYPEIIRQQVSAGKKIEIIAGNGIKVEKDDLGNYIVSTSMPLSQTTEEITIDTIDAPSYSGLESWQEGTPLQKLLEDLFYKVLPKVPSVTKGDIITTDVDGKDPFGDPNSYIDSLSPNTQYLRLFIASQIDPIYISLEQLNISGGNIDLSNYYTKEQVNAKLDILSEKIDSIEIPETNLDDYYTKEEVNAELDTLSEKIDSIEIPETNLDDYYTKEEVHDVIKDIDIQISPDSEPITIIDIAKNVKSQENQINQVSETINNIDKTIVQVVTDEMATVEDAHEIFDNIFEK